MTKQHRFHDDSNANVESSLGFVGNLNQQKKSPVSAWNQPAAWNQPGTGSAWNQHAAWNQLLGTTSLEEAMLGQVGSLGNAIGSLTKALEAPPVALQAAPQAAHWYQPYVGDKRPRPDFEAPRFGTRGFGSSCRRMERRWLQRRGEETPDHLKPVKAKMTKEVKTKDEGAHQANA